MRRVRALVPIWAVLCLWLLDGCGGSGGGSSAAPPQASETSPVAAGSVAVLLTDGPARDFSEVWVTITAVELLSEQGSVLLFSGEKQVDLLRLRDEAALFSLSENVPARIYDKIRLTVRSVELVRRDADGGILETVEPKLPGNGKIDLNPRAPFAVEPGTTLVVQVDMDAGKSLHVVETGNGSKYVFRPVVFVEILEGALPGRLVRLHGTVEEGADPAAGTFLLCSAQTAYTARPLSQGDDSGDRAGDHCTLVEISDSTGIFDPAGEPTSAHALAPGTEVTVVGLFEDAGRADAQDQAPFLARVVEIGPTGAFLALNGSLLSAPDASGLADLAADAAQGITGPLTLALQAGTGIFTDTGVPLEPGDLAEGDRVRVHGVLALSPTGEDLLKTSLVLVETGAEPAPSVEKQGTVTGIDLEARTLELAVEGEGDLCVSVPEDAPVFLEPAPSALSGEGEGSVPLDTIQAGDPVRVRGTVDATGCLVADTIWVQTDAPLVVE